LKSQIKLAHQNGRSDEAMDAGTLLALINDSLGQEEKESETDSVAIPPVA
jgi:hypothetical protein